jgi:adenosylcobinamide-GDP ribazoletransferase
MINALFTAVKTLTIIPCLANRKENFPASLMFFPATGLLLGIVPAVVIYSTKYTNAETLPIAAVLSLALVTWLTGCLHIDGLADCTDAFGGGHTRERVFEILKDSTHGTFGVVSIFIDLALKALLWNYFFMAGELWVIPASLMFSRSMQALSLAIFPGAKTGGLTQAFRPDKFVKATVIVSLPVTALVLMPAAGLLTLFYLLVPAVIAMSVTGWYCVKRIGGITGDCVGAINEISEIAVLLCAVPLYPCI